MLIAFRILTVLLALMLTAFGGQLLFAGWGSGRHAVHEIAWGVAEGLLMALPLALMVRRPERHAAAMQVVVAATAALIVTMGLVAAFDVFSVVIAAWVAVLVALHPARREVLRLRRPSGPALAGLVVAAGALITYALDQAALQRTAADVHAGLDHYTGTTLAAVALMLVLVLAATNRQRVAVWSGGLGLVVLGAAWLAFPDQVSSLGLSGGAAAIVAGGIAIAAGRGAATPAWGRRTAQQQG